MALSWEEAIHELYMDADEVLKQMNRGPHSARIPKDLPPVAQRIWSHRKGIMAEVESGEFNDIAP